MADKIYLTFKDSQLYDSDIRILESSGSWLNDAIISFYLEYLTSEYLSKDGSNKTVKQLNNSNVLLSQPSAMFMLNFIDDSNEILELFKPLKFTEQQLIFIPLNNNSDPTRVAGGSHWSLLVYVKNLNRFLYYDSMNGNNLSDSKRLASKLAFLQNPKDLRNLVEIKKTPQQKNGYDCGVYVCCLIEYILKSIKSKDTVDLLSNIDFENEILNNITPLYILTSTHLSILRYFILLIVITIISTLLFLYSCGTTANNQSQNRVYKYFVVPTEPIQNVNITYDYNIPRYIKSKNTNRNISASSNITITSKNYINWIKNIECSNGGIGFQNGQCICTYPYTGKHCQLIDDIYNNDKCLEWDKMSDIKLSIYQNENKQFKFNQTECNHSPIGVCCSGKYRTLNSHLLFLDSQNVTTGLQRILSLYGPWDSNDKELLSSYLLQSENSISLKFSKNDDSPTLPKSTDSKTRTNLAFVILLHNFTLESFQQLFQIIYRPKHYYVIHIDKNNYNSESNQQLYEYIKLIKNPYDNIIVLDNSISGAWGSISLVYAELISFTKLLEMLEIRKLKYPNTYQQWNHVINLSINDFPTQPLINLEKFLSDPTNINRNFLHEDIDKGIYRYDRNWLECNKTMLYLDSKDKCGDFSGLLKFINKSEFREGSQWHFLTYKYARYLVSNLYPIERLMSLKFTLIPDELYFQVSKSKSTDISDQSWDNYNYRYVPWNNKNFEVQWNELIDYPYTHFFTRKVYSTELKQKIIDKLLNKNVS
ncbi:sentrin-specific protease 8 [Tieghemostelium lacteum]|uniref:protein xylosyltransferase n=1 Tax=Tieghemostelium lacteum TaxID=361077 RepID=A0A152A0D6_TIELA|nr:sentrin-specific protease 8 [Tieghemostelium lacteum]|eukprot:KYQ99721.1 sentrin-specific protease 8 [Tieghemostelium lacteum]